MKNIICYVLGLQMMALVFGRSVTENINPQQQRKYFEGDIILPQVNLRNAKNNGRWPKGIIPYEITGNYNYKEKNLIKKAAKAFQKSTCLRWVPHTTEESWVRITDNDSKCSSELGYTGEVRTLNLGSDCLHFPTILHEMMHSAGFQHEHSRSDRDNYITIVYENIMPGTQDNFIKVNENEFTTLGLAYDYYSIMHYAHDAFSKNRHDTIIPKKKGVTLSYRKHFSKTDIIRINTWYNCRK